MQKNMYFGCRLRAANDNAVLKSRANAAELLGISESSLSNYETGKTKCVPAEMADQMASLYNAPELRNSYCVSECPIGSRKRLAVTEEPIERVAVHLIAGMEPRLIEGCTGKLLRIASYGKISEDGKKEMQELSDVFGQIAYALSEFSIIAERNGAMLWI